jgi:ATP-dependent Clp protease ATP-binding subunit ClpC
MAQLICEKCKIRPAAITLLRTVNGKEQRINLCNACAEEMQVFGQPFADFGQFFNDPMLGNKRIPGWQPREEERVNILEMFADRAKDVLVKASAMAMERGAKYLDTEHLLIGVAQEGEVGEKLLKELDVKPDDLVNYLKENTAKGEMRTTEPELSPRAKQALELAFHASRNLEHDYVGSEHILLGLILEAEGLAAQTLKKYGITETKARQAILSLVGAKGKKKGPVAEKSKTPTLDIYSRDLSQLAREGKLDPVIGRASEVQRVIQILSRRTKNNPVLIGEPGVGKTAIAEGLAARIASNTIPEGLRGKRVLALDLPGMLAGTKFRGEFEERLKKSVEEIQKASNEIILFIDELHTVVGAGSTGEGGGMDAANILKPALARGELQAIGATTLNEYRKYIEKDSALERRFQPVLVAEPSVEDAIEILRGLKDRYEAHHKVRITDEAIQAASVLSEKYIRDRFLPDKAIDLVDEAAAKVRLSALEKPDEMTNKENNLKRLKRERAAAQRVVNKEKEKKLADEIDKITKEITELQAQWHSKRGVTDLEVRASDIEQIIAQWTGIPVEKLSATELDRLLKLEELLHRRVIGQEEAVRVISEAVRRARAGMKDPKRPIGSFLFLGPTGVGKTELSRALAEALFGDEDAMIRIDMTEYMEKHAVSRLIGSPPGYVGYDEGGQLTEKVRRKPYSVILLDEIEKAHPDVMNILLQVLDDGRLTDGKGKTIDFKNTIIIATSNIGSKEIHTATAEEIPSAENWNKLKQALLEHLKDVFRPEFLNRLDEIVVFHALSKMHVQQITDLLLQEVVRRMHAQSFNLLVSSDVRNRVAQDGFDPSFGARPLRREIQHRLENPLATALLKQTFPRGATIRAVLRGDDVVFEVEDGIQKKSEKPKKSLSSRGVSIRKKSLA